MVKKMVKHLTLEKEIYLYINRALEAYFENDITNKVTQIHNINVILTS